MKQYLLDTDILLLYQVGNQAVCRQVLEHTADSLSVSIITVEEQLSGWYTLIRRVKTRDKLAAAYERFAKNVRFLSRVNVLTFSAPAIDRFEILKRQKLGVRSNDLRIAAIAIEHDATLVTRNRSDFERVPGLQIEDWSRLVDSV